MKDYNKGKVYKVINDANDLVYIGSTTQTLADRMKGHRDDARKGKTQKFFQAMREIGIEHFKILLVRLTPCSCYDELRMYEQEVMDEFNSVANGYNDIFARRDHKQWVNDNREKHNEAKRKWRRANRDRVNELHRISTTKRKANQSIHQLELPIQC